MCLRLCIRDGPWDKPWNKPSSKNEAADSASNGRLNTAMRNRDIGICGVDLDGREEKGCSWTKVGLPTTHTHRMLWRRRIVFNHYI